MNILSVIADHRFFRNDMDISTIRLQQIVRQLPPQQLRAVIDFAEFLSYKATKENQQLLKKRPGLKRLDLPIIKDVKFIGDPLLQREDMYDEWGGDDGKWLCICAIALPL